MQKKYECLLIPILQYVFYFFNGDDQSSVIVVSSLNALIEDQITKLRGNVRMVKGTDNLKAEDLKETPFVLQKGRRHPCLLFLS